VLGQSGAAQPEYEHPLGALTDQCVKHCGVPHKVVMFALSGSAIGGIVGWVIGGM